MRKSYLGVRGKLSLSYLILVILIFMVLGLTIYLPMTNYLYNIFIDVIHESESFDSKIARINQTIENHPDISPQIILEIANELDIIKFEIEKIENVKPNGSPPDYKKIQTMQRKYLSKDLAPKQLINYVQPDSLSTITVKADYLFSKARDEIFILMGKISIPVIFFGILLGFFISKYLTTPINEMVIGAKKVAQGDLNIRLSIKSKDELGELATQFNHMAEQLQKSFEVIKKERDHLKDFIANISHQLKNPLTALMSFNELMITDSNNLPAQHKDLLKESQFQIERMEWLIQNLLKLSRLDAGFVQMNFQKADIIKTIKKGIKALKVQQFKKNVNLKFESEFDELIVKHDVEWMGQAITNIVHNSFKFTPSGGLIKVKIFLDGGQVVIEVIDNGLGMTEEELKYVFDRFYCNNHRFDSTFGSGLGLAIVKSIVDLHKGEINIKSRPKKGTLVQIRLNKK